MTKYIYYLEEWVQNNSSEIQQYKRSSPLAGILKGGQKCFKILIGERNKNSLLLALQPKYL
jgi:hypothetical protein